MLELILKNQDFTIPSAIENLEQIKNEIAPKLEYYKNLIVTEDATKQAKADKAALNKLKNAIEERRKEIKKQVLGIYEPLEQQCKEVVALIDEPIKSIDAQLKAFDEAEQSTKLTKLQTAFYEMPHPDWLAFSDVCPEKWKNKTEALEKLIEQIAARVETINADIMEISEMYKDNKFLTPILNKYAETKSKAEALAYAVQMEKAEEEGKRKREEEIKAQLLEAAEQAKREQAQQQAQEQPQPQPAPITPAPQPEPVNEPAAEPQQAPVIIVGKFEVMGTPDQIKALGRYMRDNGIQYRICRD